jgi:hypothetical protein
MKFVEVALLIVVWENSVRQSEFGTWHVGLLNDIRRQEAGQLLDSETEWMWKKTVVP